jgi:glycosyltransferase involved in cell wall biosynthesis
MRNVAKCRRRLLYPSQFARRKYIEGGFPADKIAVKPNFVFPDPGSGDGRDGGAIYVGRLSPEKGITSLLAAWQQHQISTPLTIVGDGPMADEVRAAVQACDRIKWLGRRPFARSVGADRPRGAAGLTVHRYETFGRTIVEAIRQRHAGADVGRRRIR